MSKSELSEYQLKLKMARETLEKGKKTYSRRLCDHCNKLTKYRDLNYSVVLSGKGGYIILWECENCRVHIEYPLHGEGWTCVDCGRYTGDRDMCYPCFEKNEKLSFSNKREMMEDIEYE